MKKGKGKKGIKFDGKDILNIALAALIVNDAPMLVSQLTGKPFDGMTEEIVGAGLGVVIGTMSKNPTITNASLAIAVFNIMNGYIVPQLQKVAASLPAAGTQKQTAPVAINDYVSLPANGLSAYVGSGSAGAVSSYNQYSRNYARN